MKKFFVIFLVLLIIGSLLSACDGSGVVLTGEKIGGEIVERTLEIPNRDDGYILTFKNISFSDDFSSNYEKITISVSNRGENAAVCSYPEDFDKFGFKIEVKGEEIIVSTDKERIYLVEEFRLKLDARLREVRISGGVPLEIDADQMPLELISIDGATRTRAENITAETFALNLAGAGSVEITGKANQLNLDFAGAGEINAKNLFAKQAEVSMGGAGSVTVSCEEKLNVKLDGAGVVNYYGSPEVDSRVTGIGTVKQLSPNLP